MRRGAGERLLSVRGSFAPNRSELRLGQDQLDAVRALNRDISDGRIAFEVVACICGSSDFRELAGTDRYGLLQRTVICTRCGLVQSNPRMTDAAYADFYESGRYRQVYDGGADVEEDARAHREEHALGVFARVTAQRPAPAIGSLLEFGAGGGWNLPPFITAGIPVVGYDLSPDLVERGRRSGIDLRQGGLDDVEGTFDVILMIHVLEHLTDVPGALAGLQDHLNPGGMLFIEVPDIERFFLAQLQNAHTYYFSRKTLEYVASQAGFVMTHVSRADAQISAAFAATDSAPLTPDFLDGHYDEMVRIVRRFQLKRRLRAPSRLLIRSG